MTYKPEGNIKTAHFIFVGEAPARNEIILGRPFVGPAGELFEECLTKSGISRRDCYITNVFDVVVRKDKDGNIFDP